jgi:hypothetical protein
MICSATATRRSRVGTLYVRSGNSVSWGSYRDDASSSTHKNSRAYIYISQETQESEVYDSKRYHIRTSPTPMATNGGVSYKFFHALGKRARRPLGYRRHGDNVFRGLLLALHLVPYGRRRVATTHTPIHKEMLLLGVDTGIFVRGYDCELDLVDAKDIRYRYSSIFVEVMSWISHQNTNFAMWRRRCCITACSPASSSLWYHHYGSIRCLGGSRESLLKCGHQQRRARWATTTTTTAGDSAKVVAACTHGRLPLVISRRAVEEQKQKLARDLKNNQASLSKPAQPAVVVEDLPWPRNIVRAAYVLAAIAVPYTLAWLVSTNATLRNLIIPARILNEASPLEESSPATTALSAWSVRLVHALRRHFGVTDWESLSEPEAVDLQYGCSGDMNPAASNATSFLPHRFVDEPTARLRRQQAWLQDWLDTGMIAVRFHAPLWRPDNDVDNNHASSSVQCTLPATTLARHDVLRATVQSTLSQTRLPPFLQLPLVAIDFPETTTKKEEAVVMEGTASIDSESQMDKINDDSQTGASASTSLSIYSPWHYHVPPLPASSSSSSSAHNAAQTKSRAQVEAEWHVARLDHEIAQLQAELQSGATFKPIDNLQEELKRKQKERFQWQCKKWMGISW